jgi:hypothetical protein
MHCSGQDEIPAQLQFSLYKIGAQRLREGTRHLVLLPIKRRLNLPLQYLDFDCGCQ